MIIVDKELPISITDQIEGCIEFGVMLGYYQHNAKLPSVAKLSKSLGVSHQTVAIAYQKLKDKGILETKPGAATTIKNKQIRAEKIADAQLIKKQFTNLLKKADKLGVDKKVFFALLNEQYNNSKHLTLAYIGNSKRMTGEYAAEVQRALKKIPLQINSFSFDEIEQDGVDALLNYDVILTIPHCVNKVKALLPYRSVALLAPVLTPAAGMAAKVGQLNAGKKLLLIAKEVNFFPILKAEIQQLNPAISEIDYLFVSDDGLAEKLSQYEQVIYATGCHRYLADCQHPQMFEFKHLPDLQCLKRDIIPEIIKIYDYKR